MFGTGHDGFSPDGGTVMPGRIVVNTTRESGYFVYGRQHFRNRIGEGLPVISHRRQALMEPASGQARWATRIPVPASKTDGKDK